MIASTRRLAAILAADVAGYSRLMGADEEGTHERLKAHLRQLIDPKIKEHQGRIVKNTGDGMLAEFPSVVDAVRCAAEVQRGMIDREPMVTDERRIRFRIGINLGDVIAEDGDIFGDGVNVAARLEALAEPGGICVSRTVRDQIRDKLPYALDDMGEQSVKNIARPVRVYALRPEAVADLPARSVPLEASRSRPITPVAIAAAAAAVLVIAVTAWWLWPTTRSSSDRDGGGRAGRHVHRAAARRAASVDRRAALHQSQRRPGAAIFRRRHHRGPDDRSVADRGHFVISRNTAFTYKDKPVNAKQIGRELGVRYVLEGSVQRSGKQVRVNAQLIDAETDAHLWAERFDRDIGDLFALQNEITSRIASRAQPRADRGGGRPTDRAIPTRWTTFFGDAPHCRSRRTRDNYAEAISLFERALALDPRFRRGAELVGERARGPRARWNDRHGRGRHRTRGRADRASLGGIAPQPVCALRQRSAAARAGPTRGGHSRIRDGARSSNPQRDRRIIPV